MNGRPRPPVGFIRVTYLICVRSTTRTRRHTVATVHAPSAITHRQPKVVELNFPDMNHPGNELLLSTESFLPRGQTAGRSSLFSGVVAYDYASKYLAAGIERRIHPTVDGRAGG